MIDYNLLKINHFDRLYFLFNINQEKEILIEKQNLPNDFQ